MRRRAAIGIDDDLAAGQATIAVWSADYEAPSGIDVEMRLVAHPAVRQHVFDMRPDDRAHLFLLDARIMLRRDQHGRCANQLPLHVLQGDLALRGGAVLWLRA